MPEGDGSKVNADRHVKFACPYCGQRGEVVWGGLGHVLKRLSEGFHVEEDRVPDTRHVIICNRCDEIDPPRVLR